MPDFVHLHVHSQYSLLDGAASIPALMKKASADGMKAIALTDHGNMFGAFNFVAEANKYNIKPIIGCEFYVVKDRHEKSFSKENKDIRYHQLMLAKNEEGYKNLTKLCSLGYMEGLYSKWPRIDKELILKYHKGLIATTCCIGAEVPQAILKKSEAEAEEIFKWWLDLFGEDYYIELQRHNLENIDGSGLSQEDVNQILLKWAKKYDVKVIATNDSHYIDEDDNNAHDILLCVNTGELQNTPIGDGKGYRFGFPNNQFYFKTQEEMNKLFSDVAHAVDFTNEIADKVEPVQLQRDILLPNYSLPAGFATEDDYLHHITFEGAKKRYKDINEEVEERLNHELHIIRTMGFAGYFLIVQDFIAKGREIGVAVGPGRGSAAGSAVAYCIGITNIDPIKYSLLFERFLNPERVSMPDIDTDFDDEGRQKVIDYVVDKYGKNQVAQIITYGSMAAKSSLKDVARVMDLPLAESNALSKLVPDKPGTTLDKVMHAELPKLKEEFGAEDVDNIQQFRAIAKGDDIKARVIKEALRLEGSVRNTGIHAAGIIIAPDDLTDYIPVATSKDTDLLITQFDGKVIESAGMLKMDFLGLKTLTIIKDALALIKANYGKDIDIDEIPLDDAKTFELYQRGDTIGTFQFESEGMRMYLRDLKPTDIEDLIAMNALYRPGPMQFIPNFINRKHGKEQVVYPHELLEGILKNTYGIMVYQEQIMQTAQIMAGYSLGGADLLRRAMGKKDREKMAKERVKFVKGAEELHNVDNKKAEEVFSIMERFAEYGFNRSHSAAYSVVAYQTGYLKANYPAEYMAAVLTHNMSSTDKLNFFIEECAKQGVKVLGPDMNESAYKFSVNKEGQIRFGLGAIKGVGQAAVEAILQERTENGPFSSIFDFTKRANLRAVNKKCIESLAYSGAFDAWTNLHRAQYFHQDPTDGTTLIERSIRFSQQVKALEASTQGSLFGEVSEVAVTEPPIPECEPWLPLDQLNKEKEMVGFYLSGHPLDDYKIEIESFCTHDLSRLNELKGRVRVTVAGIISKVIVRKDRNGDDFGIFSVEDYNGTFEFRLFKSEFLKYGNMLQLHKIVLLKFENSPRRYPEGEFEMRLQDVSLLSELLEKSVRNITLFFNYMDISESLTGKLVSLLEQHQGGTCSVFAQILNGAPMNTISALSQNYRPKLTHEFLLELRSLPSVTVRLGTDASSPVDASKVKNAEAVAVKEIVEAEMEAVEVE